MKIRWAILLALWTDHATSAREPAAPPASGDAMFLAGRRHLEALDSGGKAAPSLDRLRTFWFLSVAEDSMLPRARSEWEVLRRRQELTPDLDRAYQGALEVVEAKHALWPPAKLDHLKKAAPLLDSAVARSPDHPEIRYLRLMSCYYLPRIFGRKWSVDADFQALARLLPLSRGVVPDGLRAEVATFVLENFAGIDPRDRSRLVPLAAVRPDRGQESASRR